MCASAVLALNYLMDWQITRFEYVFALQLGIYAIAVWLISSSAPLSAQGERRALIAILVFAACLRAIALWAPQTLSTDAYRYVWDGRVQAGGINPYRFVPADPALAALRDGAIYPHINRANYAHTIYPPAAQLSFLAIERLSDSITGMKVGMVAFEAIGIACILGLLRRNGLSSTRVLLYAWHPLPIWEFAGTGHVDAVAIALVMLVLLAASRGARWWTGIALAGATLVKFYPVVIAPAVYRRWDWRMPLAFVVSLIVLYAPYLGVGSSVLGFLPGYSKEEGLRDGSGIFLWSLLRSGFQLPPFALQFYAAFVMLVMLLGAVWLQFSSRVRARGDPGAALLLAGVFTLLVSPHDPWYFTWLVPFLCFRFSAAHLWLTAACGLMYASPNPTGVALQALIYIPFLLLLVFQYFTQRRLNSSEAINANRAPNQLSA